MLYIKPRTTRAGSIAAALLAPLACPVSGHAGDQVHSVRAGDVEIGLHLRHPVACEPHGILLVFHGRRRNAADYLDYAAQLAERHCLLLAAPRFDREQFTWRLYTFQRRSVFRG